VSRARSVLVVVLTICCLGLASPATSGAGLSAEATFSQNGIIDVRLSPKGTWTAARAISGNRDGLMVRHNAANVIEPLFASEQRIGYFLWVDDATMIVAVHVANRLAYVLIDVDHANGRIRATQSRSKSRGFLVSPVATRDGEVVWGTIAGEHTYVHRLSTQELIRQGEEKTRSGREARLGDVMLQIRGVIDHWVSDTEGQPQVAVQSDEDEIRILRRKRRGKAFDSVYSYSRSDGREKLSPISLVSGSRRFYVLGYAGENTIGLHEFDPDRGEVVREVFRRDDVDVTDVLVDPISGEPIAVESLVGGERSLHYLEAFAKRNAEQLGALGTELPVESVRVRAVSPDGETLILHHIDAQEPGRYLNYDASSGRLSTVGKWRSDLDRGDLANTETFRVASQDGFEIEAYLTLPKAGEAPFPLVVMPHGGPAGVRDTRLYNPVVQYLASWGFAVLQPNYRGSFGYGLEYSEAIKKQWSKAIEDDIDAAVEHAMARSEVDGDRVCIIGASYGGFSALASVVRHRDRYRCAISINGVSDIPLLYDSSDMADSKRVMDFYEEYVGDLETERETLEETSPIYHVDDIETPVLFIYGDQDRRVDPDHSRRMMLMMDLYEKPYESLEIEGMRHGPSSIQWVIVMRSARRMLTRHLLPGQAFEMDPDVGSAGVGRLKHRLDLDF